MTSSDPGQSSPAETTGPRERRREQTRRRLREIAMRLFAEKGFEATTIDEIAAAAGVSPRTVFRYFPTKHDLVFGDADERLASLLAFLRARPKDEPLLAAACAAAVANNGAADGEPAARAAAVVFADRALTTHNLELRDRWRAQLAAELATRDDAGEVAAVHHVAAAITLGIMEGAVRFWHDRGAQAGGLRAVTSELVELLWSLTAVARPTSA